MSKCFYMGNYILSLLCCHFSIGKWKFIFLFTLSYFSASINAS